MLVEGLSIQSNTRNSQANCASVRQLLCCGDIVSTKQTTCMSRIPRVRSVCRHLTTTHRVPRKVVIRSWGATLSRIRRRQLHHSHNRFMLRALNQRSWKGLLQIGSGIPRSTQHKIMQEGCRTALMHHFVCKAMIRLRSMDWRQFLVRILLRKVAGA